MPNAMILVDYETFYRARETNTRPWGPPRSDHRAYYTRFMRSDIELLGSLAERLAGDCRAIVRKAYANFQMFDKIDGRKLHFMARTPGLLTDAGYAPQDVHCYKAGEHRNAADIALVVDAMQIACSDTPIDRVILVVGDSDYLALVRQLRRQGIEVVVVGIKGCTSSLLRTAADRFFWFEDLLAESTQAVA